MSKHIPTDPDSAIPVNYTTCTKCGEELAATADNFYRLKTGKYGLRPECKKCIAEYNKRYHEANREAIVKSNKQWREANREYGKLYRKDNREPIAERVKLWREANREPLAERQKRYREANREPIAERNKQYYEANREPLAERGKQYREANREKEAERRKRYRATPEGKQNSRINKVRRLARKRGLPDTFTTDDWNHALTYFNGCCAVCERQLDDLFGTHKAHADHWIPLSNPDCPGTVPTNIVPLCGGTDGCNQSKGPQLPEAWLIRKFGKRKAADILEKVHDYFDSL